MNISSKNHKLQKDFEPKNYDKSIKENEVSVFSVTYCPHCSNAKKTLLKEGTCSWLTEVDTLSNEK